MRERDIVTIESSINENSGNGNNEMKEIIICGLQKTTLLDYPGHLAATVFLGGCNFRCPFCHNGGLLGPDATSLYSREELLAFFEKRKHVLEGVCITGGEPTLQPEALEALIVDLRALGLLIKLDTNGTRPDIIKHLVEQGLLDYIAMDIKAAPGHYLDVCGNPSLSIEAVKESVAWLIAGTLPYEFRTTVVKGLHTAEDFGQIGPWISGCPHYYLQNYVDSDQVLCPENFSSFSREELLAFARLVEPYVGSVSLRGIDY